MTGAADAILAFGISATIKEYERTRKYKVKIHVSQDDIIKSIPASLEEVQMLFKNDSTGTQALRVTKSIHFSRTYVVC